MERYERRRFHLNSKKYYRKSMQIARYDSLTRPLTEILGISTICVALSGRSVPGHQPEDASVRHQDERTAADDRAVDRFLRPVGRSERPGPQVVGSLQPYPACERRGGSHLSADRSSSRASSIRSSPLPLAQASARPGLRGSAVPLHVQPAGAAGYQPADRVWRDDCHRRPQRLRQNDFGQPDSAILRSR